jgi:RimJ/RimL family protein N-acetyltransferase
MSLELFSVSSTPHAKHILYDLLMERSTEEDENVNISHRTLPTWDEHMKFVASNPYRAWYLGFFDEAPIGYVSLTYRNEVGIVLFKKYRGMGFGLKLLRIMLSLHDPLPAVPAIRNGNFIANINPKNEASIKLFEGLGFKHIQNTYELSK